MNWHTSQELAGLQDEIDRLRAQLAEAQKIVELVTAERDEVQRARREGCACVFDKKGGLIESCKFHGQVSAELLESKSQLAEMRKGEPAAWRVYDPSCGYWHTDSFLEGAKKYSAYQETLTEPEPLFLAAPKVPAVLVDKLSRLSSKLYEGRLHPQYASAQIDEIVAEINAAPEPKED